MLLFYYVLQIITMGRLIFGSHDSFTNKIQVIMVENVQKIKKYFVRLCVLGTICMVTTRKQRVYKKTIN